MAKLISKELSALEDQLNFEHLLSAKYTAAAQEASDPKLKTCYKKNASQHQQNFRSLLGYLR